MTINLYQIFQTFGIFDLIAPFLVCYALIHGSLRTTKILGNQEKFYGAIAFVASLYFVYNLSLVQFAQRFVASFFYFTTLMFFFLLTCSLLLNIIASQQNQRSYDIKSKIPYFAIFIAIVSYLYAISTTPEEAVQSVNGVWTWFQQYFVETGIIFVLGIFLLFFLLTKWFSTPPRQQQEKTKDKAEKLLEGLVKYLEEEFKKN